MENVKVLSKISELVAMSGSNSVIETLKSELDVIDSDLRATIESLKFLNESSVDAKYFDSTAHVLDTTCELTFQNEIKTKEDLLAKEILKKDTIIAEEGCLHLEIETLRNSIKASEEYVASINIRLHSLIDTDPKNKTIPKYQAAILAEKQRYETLKKSLEVMESKYKTVQEAILRSTYVIEDLQNELTKLIKELDQLRKKLSSKKNYENNELKQKDNSERRKYQDLIESLEKRRKAISEDPVMLLSEIEELLNKGAAESEIFFKVQMLFDKIQSLPYMDLKGNQASAKAMTDELNRLLAEKEELEAKIATGDYEILNTEFENKRIAHLEQKVKLLTDELKALNSLVGSIDGDSRFDFVNKITDALEYLNFTEQKYSEYKKIVDDSLDESSTGKRAELQLALEAKKADVDFARDIYQRYLKEQQKDVKEASLVTVERIPALEKEIALANEEISIINERLLARKTKQKDVIAIAKDKVILEELNGKIAALTHRKQFNFTPTNLLTDIKELLSVSSTKVASEVKIEEEKPLIKVVNSTPIAEKVQQKEEPKITSIPPVNQSILPGLDSIAA